MSDWAIILPQAVENLIDNPSFEVDTTGWTSVGVVSFTREVGDAGVARGIACAEFVSNSVNDLIYFVVTSDTSAGSQYTLTAYLSGSGTADLAFYDDVDGYTGGTDATLTSTPTLVELTHTYNAGSTVRWVAVRGTGGSDTVKVDAVQLESGSYSTTYADGDQKGCEWVGQAHDSNSLRSALSTAGGYERDLKDVYGLRVSKVIGPGMPDIGMIVEQFATQPGGRAEPLLDDPRSMALTGMIIGTDADCDLHAARQALVELLGYDTYPKDKDTDNWQPRVYRYDGADVKKEIAAHLVSGLEAKLGPENRIHEKVALQLIAPDPVWYGLTDEAAELDFQDSITYYQIAARLRSTGAWSALGLGAAENDVNAIVEGQDGYIYIGGDFTSWDGIAGADYVARYDPIAGTWGIVGGVSDFNNPVEALAVGADGTIYAGGTFTNVAADANADFVAQWDGSNWSSIDQPVQGAAAITSVLALAVGYDDTLYIGGNFTNWANIAAADYFVSWDGSAYAAVGSGGTNWVHAIACARDGSVYIGGQFANWAADADADYIAVWDGSAWAAVSSAAVGGNVYALALDNIDRLYLGGAFTNGAGMGDADFIMMWDGQNYHALGPATLDSTVYAIEIAPNGDVLVGGTFSGQLYRWTGSVWEEPDTTLIGLGVHDGVLAILATNQDPLIPDNYDTYIGLIGSGATTCGGTTTVTNSGTALAYPVIKFICDGAADSDYSVIYQMRNETTGVTLQFVGQIRYGETITVDCRPTKRKITSDWSGSRPAMLLPSSQLAQFYLVPGDNLISCYAADLATASLTAAMYWRVPYESFD